MEHDPLCRVTFMKQFDYRDSIYGFILQNYIKIWILKTRLSVIMARTELHMRPKTKINI